MSRETVALVDAELLRLGDHVLRSQGALQLQHEGSSERHPRESTAAGPSSLCRPELLEHLRVTREGEHVAHEPVLDAEQQHLLELEAASESRASCDVHRRGSLVAREDVAELGSVRPVGLLRQTAEKAEDLLAAAVDTGHHAATRDGPDRVLREEPPQPEAALPARERGEDRADERFVLSPGATDFLLPASDQALDMAVLGVRERDARHQATCLRRIVVLDGCLQMLAERARLPELAAQPAEQAHRGLIGHGARLERSEMARNFRSSIRT